LQDPAVLVAEEPFQLFTRAGLELALHLGLEEDEAVGAVAARRQVLRYVEQGQRRVEGARQLAAVGQRRVARIAEVSCDENLLEEDHDRLGFLEYRESRIRARGGVPSAPDRAPSSRPSRRRCRPGSATSRCG